MDRYILRYPRGRARAGEDERPVGTENQDTTRQRKTTTNTNSGNVCSCGKVCKNEKGLKIHMGRMGCKPDQQLTQRTGQPGETEEEVVQDENHSDRSLHVLGNDEASYSESHDSEDNNQSQSINQQQEMGDNRGADSNIRKKKVKWPNSNNKSDWEQFDKDVDAILNTTLAGSIDRKIEAMTSIIYSVGLDRFGAEQRKKSQKEGRKNRREREIAKMRKDLRQLRKQYRKATDEEKPALSQLRDNIREHLKIARRAERSRRRRKQRDRARARFTADPFQFTSRLLGNKGSGSLKSSKEDVEEYLREMHSDPHREEELGEWEKLIQPEEPNQPFDESPPKLKEVADVIKKARGASAPGPNGVPYKVYKNCQRLTKRLWKLIRVIWRRDRLADSWYRAEGCFIPKEEKSEALKQFRTISLLNVEGKIYLAILARRMSRYMLENQYIDIAVQKGGVPGVSGCIEHTSVLTQIIRETKESKGELAVIWLDLANAYGTVPHKLVELTLERYHGPEKTRVVLKDYFDHLQLRFTVQDYTTAWQRLEVGIVTGCTISVILFSAAMNMIVKSVEKKSRGPWMKSGVRQPPGRAFMDDMTITTKTVIEAKWTIHELESAITWARMKVKPS
ncbi:uncharacterized protein LOC134230448 [Saccostrea cucullata]|uniref:uncharacterized protein LOC134230448 n=1 Tax=Saccostrea cuccullata TaxID=36930 RepID=UPI002ECFAEDE